MDLDLGDEEYVAPIDYDAIQAPQFVDFDRLRISGPDEDEDRARSFFEQAKEEGEFEGRISQHDTEEDIGGTEIIPNSLPTATTIGTIQGQVLNELNGNFDGQKHSLENEIGIETGAKESDQDKDPHVLQQGEAPQQQASSSEGDLPLPAGNAAVGVGDEVAVSVSAVKVTSGGNNENINSHGGAHGQGQGDGLLVHDDPRMEIAQASAISAAILKKMGARVTLPKPFHLQSIKKKDVAPGQDMYTFKARPAPLKVLHGLTGLKEKPETKVTIPVSPHFASDDRIRSRQMRVSVSALANNGTKENVEPKSVGDTPSSAGRGRRAVSITPGRSFGRGRSPSPGPGLRLQNPNATTTVIKPFSFEEREKERKRAREEKLRKDNVTSTPYVFHANPLPVYKHKATTLPKKPTAAATATATKAEN